MKDEQDQPEEEEETQSYGSTGDIFSRQGLFGGKHGLCHWRPAGRFFWEVSMVDSKRVNSSSLSEGSLMNAHP